MADSNLTVTISAETAGAVSGIVDVETRLAALEQAYVRTQGATLGLTAATTQHTAAQAQNTIETRVAAESATGLGGALDSLATHYRIVTAGAGAMGLGIEGSAAKMAAFTEVIGGLESAFPPLLIAMAALAGAFGAFTFLKDAVSQASDMQSQLETLGAAVQAQGGNWDAMSGAVEKWVDQEAMASGFLRSQLVPALNDLVTANFSVTNAEKTLAVAEEVAVAHHKDVRDITSLLIQVESGRGIGLAKLDENLKPLITDHATFSQILKQLHKDNQDQIADGSSLERAAAREKVEMEGLSLAIGDKLLPMLTNLETTILGGIQIGEHFGKAWVDSFASIIDGAKAAGDAVMFLLEPLSADGKKHLASAGTELKRAQGEGAASDKELSTWWKAPDAFTKGQEIIGASLNAHAGDVSDLSGMNQRVGNLPKGTSGAGKTVGFADEIQPSTPYDAIAAAQKDLTTQMGAMDDREKELKANIGNATTELQKQSLTAVYDAQVTADLAAKKTLLGAAMDHEVVLNQQLGVQLNAATAAAKSATTAYNTFGDSAANDGSVTAQNHLALLKQKMDDANASVTAINGKIKENSANFAENSTAIEANTIATIANSNATAKLALDKAAALQKVTDAWTAFYAKSEADMMRDLELDRMTNTQKFVYYKQLVDQMTVTDEASLQLRESYQTAELAAYKATITEQAEAYKKYIDDATKQTSSFIDDLIIKHTTLKDELKTIYSDILKQYIDMISQMMVKSKGFQSLFPFTTGQGANGATQSGGMFGGMTSMFGGGGNQSSYTNGALNVHIQNVGPTALTGLTGNSMGVSPSSTMATLNSDSSSGTSGSLTVSDGSGGGTSSATTSALSKLIGSVLGSAGAGGAVATAIGGNGELGAIGGAAGGGLGDMISKLLGGTGPAGLAIGTVLGGVIGGLFGPHETAADQPDLNDPTYGQDLANWQGAGVTVGNSAVAPSSQYYTANGGVSQSADIANWVQQNQSNLSNLTVAQQGIYQQMLAMMGGNANAGASALGITSEHQGMITLGDGTTMSVSDFENTVSNFNATVGAGASSIPTFTIGRPYPNANQSTSTQNGSISSAGITTTPTINVTVQGNVVGTNGMAELGTQIAQIIYQQQNGTLPTSGGGTIYQRNGGGY